MTNDSRSTQGRAARRAARNARHSTVTTSPRRHHAWPWVVLVVFVALVAIAGALGYRMYQQAMSAKTHLNNVTSAVSALKGGSSMESLTKLEPVVSSVQEQAAAAKSDLSGWQWDMAERIPEYGSDIKSVRAAVSVLDDFSRTTLPQLSGTVTTLMNSQLSDGNGGLNTEPIITAAGQMTTANDQLKAQTKAIQDLPEAKVAMVRTALDSGKTQLADVSDQVDQLTGMLNMLPSFLGANGARNYVLLAQTNSETRSSGGLIGSVGSVHADQGKIAVGEFHANLEFSGNAEDQLKQGDQELYGWSWPGKYIHNISSIPDFPQVASMAAEFWKQQSFGGDTDGVMSLDPVALQAMIGVTGNVTMPDGRVLTGENTAAFLLHDVYQELSVEEQNTYFADVATQVVDHMFSDMSAQKMMKLAQTLITMAEQRHMYFWSFHEEDQAALRSSNMAGEVTNDQANPVVGVYVGEILASKIDYYMDRTAVVQKTGTGADGSATYHVTVTLTNTLQAADVGTLSEYVVEKTGGSASEQVVLYTPAGGSITNIATSSGAQFAEVQREDRVAYNGTVPVAPESTVTLEFDVTTAPGAASLQLDQTPVIRNSDKATVYKE